MAKEEHTKEDEEEQEGGLRGIKAGLTLGSVASSVFGLFVATGSLAAKIVTGDMLGAAESVGAALSVIGKASGLTPVINKAGEYLKKKFGDSKVLGFIGKAWEVATSRPVRMGLKIAGIGLAIAAGLSNPVSASIVALSAGAMVASTIMGSRNLGRNKRIAQEAKDLQKAAQGIGEPERGKYPALDALLAEKLSKNKVQEVDGAKIGTSVARGSILESAALFLEAAGDADNLVGLAAAGVAALGGLADEAKEAIERQETKNRLLAGREEARVKMVCATLAKDPDINKLSPEAIEAKYKEVYKANFHKSFGTKVKSFFKDVGVGAGEYIFGGLKKVFAKKEEHEGGVDVHGKQQTPEVAKGLQKERAVDEVATPPKQIPTHIELVADRAVPPPPPTPIAKESHSHGLDPHYMETHTHVDKTEHSPHLGEGGGKVVAPRAKARS